MAKFEPFTQFGELPQQFALPLFVKIDDEIIPVGTGFVIDPKGLFITAAHVLEYANSLSVRKKNVAGQYYQHYEFYALYITDQPLDEDQSKTLGGMLSIKKVWAPVGLDIGFGWLDLPRHLETNAPIQLVTARIRVEIPKIGDKIRALGYYGMSANYSIEDDFFKLEYNQETAISEGVIVDVHSERRDNSMLHFPCFQTNARFDPGMSGGPILDDSNNVIGVVCSSYGEEAGISYGSLIWPIFGCYIDFNVSGATSPEKFLLYDLAVNGHIKTDETFEQIKVEDSNFDNRVISIRRKQLE